MKFKFKLEKVMQHRKVLEDLAQKDFQEAQFHLQQEMDKLISFQQSIIDARENAFRLQSEGGKASGGLTQVDDFIKGQEIRIQRQKQKILECESLVENLREILRQKAIDYKILEELKEKQFEKYKEERQKKEQAEVDDLNSMRFARSGK